MSKDKNQIVADKVAIVVLSYNNKEWCERTLNSVIKTDYPHDIIVVDNNSTDGITELIKSKFSQVKLIELKKNLGFIAYNQVINELDYKYIALLNNDIVVEKNWLAELMKYLEEKDVAAVTPKIRFFDKPDYINAAGGVCDIFGFGFNRGNGELDQGQYENVEEAFYGIGAALVIKKEVWNMIGGFDKRYFAYAEDLEWCWRARLVGYKVVYVPKALVYHKWQLSHNDKSKALYYMERNQISNFIKCYSTKYVLIFLLPLVALKTAKILFLYFKNKKISKYMLKAITWNLSNIGTTLEQRRNIQKNRVILDSDILKVMSKNSYELLFGIKNLNHPIVENLRNL